MATLINKSRKADKALYNYSSEDFIPIACHYNESTLLTKGGELLQILQINGINAEHVSAKLFNLRKMVRDSISKNVKTNNFAFWIHTVRRKTNLDDNAPYDKLLSANIHNLWKRKNYWDDKYVNTLYISIIYSAPEIKLRNINALINSLFYKVIINFHDKYLDKAFLVLNNTVDAILKDLQEFGAVKLGIKYQDNECISEPLFLYRRIIHLNEDNCLLPIGDVSNFLASHHYAVGSDKIEVISAEDKKFASIISIKEYPEVSSESLDKFLQVAVELIATEIFYFVNRKDVVSLFNEQNYILKVSGDSNLGEIKGLTTIIKADNQQESQFCYQQIAIAIIGNNLEQLDKDVRHASQELADIGIVHVKEDINLEQSFWAQLPGNFHYLRRMTPTILPYTAALASLHNFPTGLPYNKWGKAVTLLRTEKGTPYFLNFHGDNNRGNTCIFGAKNSGKTVLTNFLISEATKFKPVILYLANNNDSKVFIESSEGVWSEDDKELINPFLCEDTPAARKFVIHFLRLVCCHDITSLSPEALSFLEQLTDKIFTLELLKRNFTEILKIADFSTPPGELIKAKLSIFAEGGMYHGLFEASESFKLEKAGKVIGYNLFKLSDEHFTQKFYPDDKKKIQEFEIQLLQNASIRTALIYAFVYYLGLSNGGPKILAIDNMEGLLAADSFQETIVSISNMLEQADGVIIGNFNLEAFSRLEHPTWQQWIKLVDTTIILPSEIRIENLDKILDLNRQEIEKLLSFIIASRMFLIKQNGETITSELSIGGLKGMLKILSSDAETIATYLKILESYPGHPDNWLEHLYETLDK